MPRTARLLSISGIYHIMLRGINRQKIFFSEKDYELFLSTLSSCKKECNFEIYAYCIMPNHIHLLIGTTSDGANLETIFKKLGTKFVYWYNLNHNRVRHLFQDRFRSEPVDTSQYFRTVFRYILHNPYKAGLEITLGDYPWTNLKSYFTDKDSLTDPNRAISLFGNLEYLKDFLSHTATSDSINIHAFPPKKYSDKEALDIILAISECVDINDFKKMSNQRKDVYIEKFLQKGLGVKQISRITGLSKDKITKVKNWIS